MIERKPQQKATEGVDGGQSSQPVGPDDAPVKDKARYQYRDITVLPVELAEKILAYQSIRDVSVCRLVSRRWKGIIDDFHLQARSVYRSCYPDVPFTHGQEIVDRDYRDVCQWLQHFALVGSHSLAQLDQLRANANPYFCQELCCAVSAGLAQAKRNKPGPIYSSQHHNSRIKKLGLSANGKRIVSISDEPRGWGVQNTINIDYHVHGQWQQQMWDYVPGHVSSFDFTSNENDFVLVLQFQEVTVVEVGHFYQDRWWKLPDLPYSGQAFRIRASFAPCGQYLAIAGGGLELFHRTGGRWQRQTPIPGTELAEHLVFSADQHHCLVASTDLTFRLLHRVGDQWQAQGAVGESDMYKPPVFSPDGRHFVVIHRKAVTLWAYEKGSWARQRSMEGSGEITKLFFPVESRLVISYWDASPEIWELAEDNKQDHRIPFPCAAPCALTANIRISPDHKHFAWYGHNRVIIWILDDGQLREQGNVEHSDRVLDICFSADGQLLATASLDKTAKIIRHIGAVWWEQQSIFDPSGVCQVRFSPAGDYLLTTDTNGTINLWNPHGGTAAKTEY